MNLDHYELITESSFTRFQFISKGLKGKVVKLIEFQKVAEPDLYNLAFGDKHFKTGDIDDEVVTDNAIRKKCLQP